MNLLTLIHFFGSRRKEKLAADQTYCLQVGLLMLFMLVLPQTGQQAGACLAYAAEIDLSATNPAPDDSDSTVLAPVMVHGRREPLTSGTRTIDRKIIDRFPSANGSINEILSFLPDIQFSETSNLSRQGGEILPAAVSIAGGKGFENNFIIDGLGNNSMLDPDADDPLALDKVPGHAQQIFLDASLVDEITLYDSNIPASYGDFKGGLVHARTIEPDYEFGGNLFYRTTRAAWTKFHIAPSQKDDFINSEKHTSQPKFEKHQAGFDIHLPFSSRLRLLAGYRLQLSTIPLQHLGESRNQQRRNETFLVKLATEPTTLSKLDLSWTYSPYQGRYFKKDYKNSDLTILGGAYMANANVRTALPFADLHLQAGYTESENSREGPDHMIVTQNPDNTYETEGFTGDIEKTQQSIQCKTDLAFRRLSAGPVSHNINMGVDFQHIRGTSRRDKTSYLYTFYKNGTARRTVYAKHQAEAALRQYSAFAEDILRYRRLELRPGLRICYDDFMQNLNLAPRLAAALDIFGNGRTVLIGGVNRYHANTLLTYKLRQEMPLTYYETRLDDGEWTFKSSSSTITRFQSLKTPYADEYVIGLEQQVFGGKATFKYVQRDGKDEFARTAGDRQPDGFYYTSLNNNGYSRHQSYRLSWERQWQNHSLSINGTYQETTSSNESYEDILEEDDLDEDIWYNGKVLSKSQLPRKDFNRPWLVSLLYIGQFPHGITFSSLLKYRSGYQTLSTTGAVHQELGIPIYEKVRYGGAVTMNCTIGWRIRICNRQQLHLSLDILNLLDKQVGTGNPQDSYALQDSYAAGRQVWLGAKYNF